MDSQFETKRVLITGKTYPSPARKGVEVSCVGGLTEEGQWIRLFPIPFRLLADEKKFKKYDVIEVNAKRARSDLRPESYQVDQDSIRVVRSMPSGVNKWNEVRERLLPLMSDSLCEIQESRKITQVTLGGFQPTGKVNLSIEPTEVDWTPEQRQKLVAYGMFDNIPRSTLEKIPYRFAYQFKCAVRNCRGHNLSCIDWEMCQTYRNFLRTYGSSWQHHFREAYERKLFAEHDVHFLVGTVHLYPDSWMIGNVFYPPRTLARQPSLFQH